MKMCFCFPTKCSGILFRMEKSLNFRDFPVYVWLLMVQLGQLCSSLTELLLCFLTMLKEKEHLH